MDTTITNATMGIIPIKYNNDEITVLGRDLHAALEVVTPYTMWFKRMCEYGFEEGVDYVKFYSEKNKTPDEPEELEESNETKTNEKVNLESTQPFRIKSSINHQLKLDMAKEIAMIQRNEAGRKIRKYFIEVEKKYRNEKMQLKTANFHIPDYDVRAKALMSAGNCATILNTMLGVHIGIARAHSINNAEKDFNIDLSDIKKLLPASENVPVEYNPTQLAEKLTEKTGTKYTARRINAKLDELGYQSKIDGEWVLTDKGKQYAKTYPYERNGHTGFQILWSEGVLSEFGFKRT